MDKKKVVGFNIKPSHVFDINNKKLPNYNNGYYVKILLKEGEYTSDGYFLFYQDSYNTQITNYYGFKFDCLTLDGWKDALIKTKGFLKKIFKELKEKGVIVNFERPVDYRDIPIQYQEKIIDRVIDGKFEWKDAKIYISPNINNSKLNEYLIDKAINTELKWEDIKDHIPLELWNRYRGARIMSQYGI